MVREFADAVTRVVAAVNLEDLADPAVNTGTPACRQLVIEDALEQRMAERELPGPPLHFGDDLGCRCSFQCVEHVAFVALGDASQLREVEIAPYDRRDRENLRHVLAEATD